MATLTMPLKTQETSIFHERPYITLDALLYNVFLKCIVYNTGISH